MASGGRAAWGTPGFLCSAAAGQSLLLASQTRLGRDCLSSKRPQSKEKRARGTLFANLATTSLTRSPEVAGRSIRLPRLPLLLLLPPGLPSAIVSELCPRHLDCTLQRRKECPLGSHACGPCLPQFVEDGEGRCVTETAAPKGQTAVAPNPEEEIDLVLDALAKQGRGPLPHGQEESPAPTGQHSRNGASKAESPQGGRRGWPDPSSRPSTEPLHNPPVESTRISSNDALILGLIVVCTAAGVAALVVATICWCRLQREIQLAQKADYPANKLPQIPPYDKLSPGDRKLAQSAQMYHYQHQKQQMLSLEKNKEEAKAPESVSSDEENEDGDFTVYECPGLAPTGEMEVKNPLFDDSTLPPKLHP